MEETENSYEQLENILNNIEASQLVRNLGLNNANEIIEIKEKLQDISERKEYARHVYDIVVGSLLALFFLLVLSGGPFSFHLSDDIFRYVILAIVLEVVGLFTLVISYLFTKK